MKIVVFDFDGTLADTLPLCITAYQDTAEQVRGTRPSVAEVESFFGLNDTGVLAGVLGMSPDSPALPMAAFLQVYKELHPSLAPALFEGAREMLDSLREAGYEMALITGKEACTAEPSMEFYGIRQYFSWFGYGKPGYNAKSERLRELMAEKGLLADDMVYVGDAPSDINSSHEVGVKIINCAWAADSARYTEACLALAPDVRLASMAELLPMVKSLLPL